MAVPKMKVFLNILGMQFAVKGTIQRVNNWPQMFAFIVLLQAIKYCLVLDARAIQAEI